MRSALGGGVGWGGWRGVGVEGGDWSAAGSGAIENLKPPAAVRRTKHDGNTHRSHGNAGIVHHAVDGVEAVVLRYQHAHAVLNLVAVEVGVRVGG